MQCPGKCWDSSTLSDDKSRSRLASLQRNAPKLGLERLLSSSVIKAHIQPSKALGIRGDRIENEHTRAWASLKALVVLPQDAARPWQPLTSHSTRSRRDEHMLMHHRRQVGDEVARNAMLYQVLGQFDIPRENLAMRGEFVVSW